jgi:predicted RecA/RadA family phage recombinase
MADTSDVESSFVGVIASYVYPNGTAMPSAILNAASCRVYRGWPVEANLKKDLSLGVANISVFSRNGVEIVSTRYPPERKEITRQELTLTATVDGSTITIAGSVQVHQTIMVKVGPSISIAYAIQAGDTLTSIATGIATLLSASVPGTTSNGHVVTIQDNAHAGLISARVVTVGQVGREVKRTDKSFQISLWSPTPQLRDSLAKTVDPMLGDLRNLMLADGSVGWNRYEYTIEFDTPSEEGLYRRDLFYRVEYPTLIVEDAYEIGAIKTNLTGTQEDPLQPPAPTTPVVPIIITR